MLAPNLLIFYFDQKKADERGWAPLIGLLLGRTEVLSYPFNPPQ
jgi:hypothetical protein